MSESLIISFVTFAWLGIITVFLVRFFWVFSKLTKGVSEKDLSAVLGEILKKVQDKEEFDKNLFKQVDQLETDGLEHIQKIGLTRYNPFSETGGNQSFILALLDANNTGVVITSLHSREATRVFAKPVKEGKEAGYEFSKEEIQAVLLAQKKKTKD